MTGFILQKNNPSTEKIKKYKNFGEWRLELSNIIRNRFKEKQLSGQNELLHLKG